MLSLAFLWKLAARLPLALPVRGSTYHRLGLAALHDGCPAEAVELFERAALRYRLQLSVEPLARVRTHQAIARYRAQGATNLDDALEIERQLYRLRMIEALDPPHALLDAGRMLAAWSRDVAPVPVPISPRLRLVSRRRA
jgi:hypothetical protein